MFTLVYRNATLVYRGASYLLSKFKLPDMLLELLSLLLVLLSLRRLTPLHSSSDSEFWVYPSDMKLSQLRKLISSRSSVLMLVLNFIGILELSFFIPIKSDFLLSLSSLSANCFSGPVVKYLCTACSRLECSCAKLCYGYIVYWLSTC